MIVDKELLKKASTSNIIVDKELLKEGTDAEVRPFHRVLIVAQVPVMDLVQYEYDHLLLMKHEQSPYKVIKESTNKRLLSLGKLIPTMEAIERCSSRPQAIDVLRQMLAYFAVEEARAELEKKRVDGSMGTGAGALDEVKLGAKAFQNFTDHCNWAAGKKEPPVSSNASAAESGAKKEFRGIDTNKDNKLSKKEWVSKYGSEEGFSINDLNRDIWYCGCR